VRNSPAHSRARRTRSPAHSGMASSQRGRSQCAGSQAKSKPRSQTVRLSGQGSRTRSSDRRQNSQRLLHGNNAFHCRKLRGTFAGDAGRVDRTANRPDAGTTFDFADSPFRKRPSCLSGRKC
jgi:hypothetical protein